MCHWFTGFLTVLLLGLEGGRKFPFSSMNLCYVFVWQFLTRFHIKQELLPELSIEGCDIWEKLLEFHS